MIHITFIDYRKRWLDQCKLIEDLQEELANKELPAPLPPPRSRRVLTQVQPANNHKEAWKVSARTIKGVTSIYAKRGGEVEELERVAKSSPSYQTDFAAALARANRTIEAKNSRG